MLLPLGSHPSVWCDVEVPRSVSPSIEDKLLDNRRRVETCGEFSKDIVNGGSPIEIGRTGPGR